MKEKNYKPKRLYVNEKIQSKDDNIVYQKLHDGIFWLHSPTVDHALTIIIRTITENYDNL